MKKLPITNRKKFKCTYKIPSKNVELFVFNYSDKTVHFHRNDTTAEGVIVCWKDNPFRMNDEYDLILKR